MTCSDFKVEAWMILDALDRLDGLAADDARLRRLAEAAVFDALNSRNDIAVERVATALRDRLVAVLSRASRGPVGVKADEVLWLDAVGIDVLAETAPAGVDLALHVRENAVERWELALAERNADAALALWVPGPQREWHGEPLFVLYAAAAAWHDIVEPRLRSQLTEVPALSAAVVRGAHAALWRRDREIRQAEGRLVITTDGRCSARLREVTLTDELLASLRASRTLTGHRFVRWLTARTHEQVAAGRADARRVSVTGGISGLAKALAIRSDKGAAQLHEVLEFGQHVELELPGNLVHGLWTFTLKPARGTRPSNLSIITGDPLLPFFVNGLPKGTASLTEARRLIPFPEMLPPAVGHQKWLAGEATLQLLVLREMRTRADEFAATGGIILPRPSWLELLDEADLPVRLLDDILSAWTEGDSNSPAFLRRGDALDFYALAPAYEVSASFLRQAAKRSELARVAQRSSVRSRRARKAALLSLSREDP